MKIPTVGQFRLKSRRRGPQHVNIDRRRSIVVPGNGTTAEVLTAEEVSRSREIMKHLTRGRMILVPA